MTAIRLQRVLRDTERLPWYYGVAWYQDFGLGVVVYPLGLHWVARALREVWWAMHGPGYLARRDLAIHSAGHREGWAACERAYQSRIQRVERELDTLQGYLGRKIGG